MNTYINYRAYGEVETIDEFETRKEARAMLTEYQMAFTEGRLYLSQRPTKQWKDPQPCATQGERQ